MTPKSFILKNNLGRTESLQSLQLDTNNKTDWFHSIFFKFLLFCYIFYVWSVLSLVLLPNHNITLQPKAFLPLAISEMKFSCLPFFWTGASMDIPFSKMCVIFFFSEEAQAYTNLQYFNFSVFIMPYLCQCIQIFLSLEKHFCKLLFFYLIVWCWLIILVHFLLLCVFSRQGAEFFSVLQLNIELYLQGFPYWKEGEGGGRAHNDFHYSLPPKKKLKKNE